jgi:predicted metal-binding protein
VNEYLQKAQELGMLNAMLISPAEVFFDIRAVMKCRWGCEDFFSQSIKCHVRDTTFQERVEMVRRYNNILLLHSHNARELSIAVLEIERKAFLDGHYFAFGIRYYMLCKECAVQHGKPCPTPNRIRPCDQGFGIDVYKTARHQGLPCKS